MHRALVAMNLVLGLTLAGLWWLDASLEGQFEEERQSVSKFLPLGEPSGKTVADVRRLELTLPGSATTWLYAREKDGWRLPEFRDAFALGRELEAVLQAVLESRGTIVGRVPGNASHFGLDAVKTLRAHLLDGAGTSILRAQVGRIAPGARGGESFMTATGSDVILHMNANPWPSVQWTPGGRLPPLLDTRVTPLAIGRGSVATIRLGGPDSGALKELERREIPQDPQFGRQQGPLYEWYGKLANGTERRLNDQAAFTYSRSLGALAFDDFVGTRARQAAEFKQPSLIVTLIYDGDAGDTLTLGGRTSEGFYHLHQSTTNQAFLISTTKAKALRPNLQALFEPAPRPPTPQAPQRPR